MAAVSKRGRGRKALNAVTESEVNISAGVTEISETSKESVKAVLSPSKAKNVKSKNKAAAQTETSSPAFSDELEKLQAQLQQLQIEKSKTEEMLKEKDEILKKKDGEQEKLQAELKKLQRVKEFKPTVVYYSVNFFCSFCSSLIFLGFFLNFCYFFFFLRRNCFSLFHQIIQ
jgi:upstream-binding transcription factor